MNKTMDMDESGLRNAYVAGSTESTDVPTTRPLQRANAGGCDAFVTKITMAPGAPTGLTATAKWGRVALNWTGSSGAVRYNVYQGTAPGAESTMPVKKVIIRTTATIFRLTSGMTYFFEVAAVNAGGTSALSNEASAAPR